MNKRKSEHRILEEIIKNATQAALAQSSKRQAKKTKIEVKRKVQESSESELSSVESEDESSSKNLMEENKELKEEVQILQHKCAVLEQENSDLRSTSLRLKVFHELDLALEQIENITDISKQKDEMPVLINTLEGFIAEICDSHSESQIILFIALCDWIYLHYKKFYKIDTIKSTIKQINAALIERLHMESQERSEKGEKRKPISMLIPNCRRTLQNWITFLDKYEFPKEQSQLALAII